MGRKTPDQNRATVRLSFRPGGAVEGLPEETILNAAWRNGLAVPAPCGGQGICGRCRVRVEGAAPPTRDEKDLLSREELRDGWRLACHSPVAAGATVHLPGRRAAAAPIPARTILPRRGIRPAGPAAGYGAAVDLGTTTIAVQLWDLSSGHLVATASSPNPQGSYGADVISRISAASDRDKFETLRDLLRGGVADLVGKTALDRGLKQREITVIIVAGNTILQHFFVGADPSSLARAPFTPSFLEQPSLTASSLGLRDFDNAVLRLVPCVSAFLGGDAVAGLTAIIDAGGPAPSLLIDMGTNAEVVLLRKRTCLATSAAAGPALEGGNISAGVPAGLGAVEGVDFSGDISLEVIGGGPPLGICGSGLLDLTALLLKFGLLLPEGRLLNADEAAGHPWKKLSRRLAIQKGVNSFIITPAGGRRRSLAVTQKDLRELQLARSAIVTAWSHLLRKARMAPTAIERVYLAGGFGYTLKAESLIRTGLLHESWQNRLTLLGNASLSGASLMLLNEDLLVGASRLARSVRALHLAETPTFQKEFIHNLSFPES